MDILIVGSRLNRFQATALTAAAAICIELDAKRRPLNAA